MLSLIPVSIPTTCAPAPSSSTGSAGVTSRARSAPAIDTDGDGTQSPGERAAWATREAAAIAGRVDLRVNGVEVPLGLALVVSGIRSAASQVIATATIIAYGGLGGLGRFIIDGYSTQDYGQVYGGAVLVAGLALAAEAVLALSQRAAARRRAPSSRGRPVTVDPNLDLLRQVSDAPSPAAYPP